MESIEDLYPLIEKYGGNIAAVARAARVSRQTIYNRIKEHPELSSAIEDARESQLDNIESALYQKAIAGDTTAMIFVMKTRGKGRGYSERLELTGADGGAIQTEGKIDVRGLSTDELESLYRIATKLNREPGTSPGD